MRDDLREVLQFPIRELHGRVFGVIGWGDLGRGAARVAAAFGMRVVVAKRLGAPADEDRMELTQLLAIADILSLHCPLNDSTRGLIGARELALMKPGAYLINTSRGPIVVEADLLAALRAGKIAGAGLDVFDEEPPPRAHPFRTMDNVTVAPHLGYVTREALTAFYVDTLEAVAAFVNGALIRIANPAALAHRRK